MAEPWTYALRIIRRAQVSVKNQKQEDFAKYEVFLFSIDYSYFLPTIMHMVLTSMAASTACVQYVMAKPSTK